MHHINQTMSSENGIIFTPELPFELFTPDCQSLIRDYECPLCKGVTKDPVVDSCGHIFCKKCFILSFSENQMCPISKVKLTTQPTNVLIITQILEKQKLFCQNKKDGCQWKGSLRELEEHLSKDCEKQKIKCENEGCNVYLPREEMSNHIKVCQFKKEPCDYCNAIMVVNQMEEHLKVCPRVEVLCDQNCGMKLPREELDVHKKDFCAYSLLKCPYVEYGCNDKEIFRKDFDEKMKKDSGKHLVLIVKTVDKLSKKLDYLQKEIEYLKSEENVKKMIDEYLKNNKIEFQQSNIPFMQQEKKKLPEIQMNNHSTPDGNTITNAKNEIHFIQKKHERQKEDNDSDIDVPIVFTANPLSSPSKSGSSKVSKETPFFDIANLKSSITIVGTLARFTSNTRPEHTFLFTSKNIDTTTCSDFPSWKIKFLSSSLWLGVGLCDKKKVLTNKMRFVSPRNDRNAYHGSYLISTNGYTWNCNNEEENNRQIELPEISKGTIMEIIFNKAAKQLTFKVGGSTVKLTNVTPLIAGDKMLTPCVVFLHSGNSVEFLDVKF